MKLYQSLGPNPRVVRMFIQEKLLDVEMVEVDIVKGENRQGEFLTVNPVGQTPALETDEGQFITEITAICEYLEELHPAPPLIGESALERALTRMWCRRIDLNILEPLTNGFRFAEGLAVFKDRIHCIPQAADDLKAIAQEHLSWLDKQMEGKQFIVGERFSLADIMLYVFLDFGQKLGQALNPDNHNIVRWFEQMAARPSVAQSQHASGR